MTEKFILWAQALDNASPDHFYFRGEKLSADDSVRREEAVSLVSSVIKKGERVYDVGGVRLTVDGHHFVLEVLSAERDRAGRAAPIVCYGEYDAAGVDALGDDAFDALRKFAKDIGRTLQPERAEIERAFEELKKNTSTLKPMSTVGIAAAVLVLLAMIFYWLARRSRP